jgi:hypothetical protein
MNDAVPTMPAHASLTDRGQRMKKDSSLLGATGLRMTWVPVHLPDGRVRMEMRWRAPSVVTKQPAA